MPVSRLNPSISRAGLLAGSVVCLSALAAVLFAVFGPGASIDVARPTSHDKHTTRSVTTSAAPNQPKAASLATEAAFVRSLPSQFKGTDVDGAITVGPDGDLNPTRAIRELFDYFISGYGRYAQENQWKAVRKTIADYAQTQGVSTQVQTQLLALFDDYIRLRQRVVDESPSFADTDMATRLRILEEIRIAELGPEVANAFYGQEQKAMQQAIAQRNGQSPSASPDDANRRASLPSRLAADVANARQQGADDAAIHAMRLEAVGPDATARLEALDAKRQRWRDQYDAYARQRDAIRRSAMSQADRQDALQALRQRDFAPEQQRRVEALDRIAEQQRNAS